MCLCFSYEISVGTTPGGGQIKPFFRIDATHNAYTVSNIDLNGQRQVGLKSQEVVWVSE